MARSHGLQAYEHLLSRRSLVIYTALVLTGLVALTQVDANVLPSWSPDENAALFVIWQVHAAFVSIGFTGLAISFQLLSDPPLTAGPARRSVIQYLRFPQLLAFGVLSDVLAGLAAIWLRSDINVIVVFVTVLIPSIVAIASTYARTVWIFGWPHVIERLTLKDLKDRVRVRAESLKLEREKNDRLAAIIKSVEGISQDIFEPEREPTDRISYEGDGGTVNNVIIERLKEAANLLAASEGQSGPPSPTRERIYFRPQYGVELRKGDLLARVNWPERLGSKTRAKIEQALQLSVEVDGLGNAGTALQRELDDLQDNVINAIQARRLSRCERGFEYYSSVLGVVRQVVVADPPSTLRPLSDHSDWDWLNRHLWEINHNASKAGDRLAIVATGAAYDRCIDAARGGDLIFLNASLTSFEQIWSSLVIDSERNVHAIEHLVVSLQNLTEYSLPFSSTPELVREYGKAAIWTWVLLIKDAMDLRSVRSANLAADYNANLYKHSNKLTELVDDVQKGRIVLVAWVLHCRDKRDTHWDVDLQNLLSKTPKRDVLSNTRDLLHEGREERRWSSWEMRDLLPIEFRILTMSDYVARAALLLLAQHPIQIPATVTQSDSDTANHLLQQAAALKEDWPSDLGQVDSVDSVEPYLQAVVNLWESSALNQLWNANLDPGRIKKFIDAVSDELVDERRLLYLFDQDGPLPDINNFSFSTYGEIIEVPKHYFVETHMLAEPELLGRQLARRIRYREEMMVIKICQSVGASQSGPLSEIRDHLTEWSAGADDPAVIIFNSYLIADKLGYTHTSRSITLNNVKVSCFLLFMGDVDEHVAAVDRVRTPRSIRLGERRSDLSDLEQLRMAVGVMPVARGGGTETPRAKVEFGAKLAWAWPSDPFVQFWRVLDADA
jgi:hypothetical protein